MAMEKALRDQNISYKTVRNYFQAGPLDFFIQHMEADYLENGLKNVCLESNFQHLPVEDKAKVCVQIVNEWLNVFTQQEKEAFEEYVQDTYWLAVLQNGDYNDAASQIPDDLVQRLVFHFVYEWENKFKMLFLDSKVQEQQKVDVLCKQLDNFMFIYRRRLHGGIWYMDSMPDEILKQALSGEGEVLIRGQDGEPVRTITGQPIIASASKGVSQALADGPKPDDLDKKLFKDVLEYAKNAGLKNLDSWTLVRASFKYGKDKEIRCYAFSGVSMDKKETPSKWWETKETDDFNLKENINIFVPVVDDNPFGQNLIMSIFRACRRFYEKDLCELTKLIAFEEYSETEYIILVKRNDLFTLDYGEYYDIVTETVNEHNKRITKTVSEVLQVPDSELSKELLLKITCGAKNQQYKPNEDGLDDAVNKNLKSLYNDKQLNAKTNTVKKISQDQLSKLKRKLDQLPASYLNKLEKILSDAHCGEDNVLPFLLGKLIENVCIFLTTRVEFVALDKNNLAGKRFCERCDRKVRFFSILPSIMRSLGISGTEDDLLEKLKELFNIMNTTQNNMHTK